MTYEIEIQEKAKRTMSIPSCVSTFEELCERYTIQKAKDLKKMNSSKNKAKWLQRERVENSTFVATIHTAEAQKEQARINQSKAL